MNKRAMTVKEIAVYLGLHTDTIYDMVREDRIPHFRIGRKIFFLPEAIESWIIEKTK